MGFGAVGRAKKVLSNCINPCRQLESNLAIEGELLGSNQKSGQRAKLVSDRYFNPECISILSVLTVSHNSVVL